MEADFRQAGRLSLDFGGKAASGLCLTDAKCRNLLDDIMLLLGVQTHRDSAEGSRRGGSEHSDKRAVKRMTLIIDYFLVRAGEFRLANQGFSSVTENQLRQLLVDA